MRTSQVTILGRRADDELLLLASDGLWDVLSNQEACTLAKRCLRRARQRGASCQSAARIAATVLTRAAVDRGSRDNVTVRFQSPQLPSAVPAALLSPVSVIAVYDCGEVTEMRGDGEWKCMDCHYGHATCSCQAAPPARNRCLLEDQPRGRRGK